MTPVIFWITPLSFSRKTDSEFSLQPRAQLNSRVSFARLLKSSVWFSNPVAKRSYWTRCARYRGGWPSSCTPLKLTQRKSLVFFWLVGSLSRVVWLAGAVIAIPLDAHRGWFKATDDSLLAARRADLLLISFDSSRRIVKCVVVEVKLREELTASGRSSLYSVMREQAETTEKRIRDLFDPHLYPTPRADLALRSKELMTALSFYLQRAARYNLLSPGELPGALQFVDSLDSPYSLEISSLGVVFERQGIGAHIDEEEPGFTVHRFGLDVAQRLVGRACGKQDADSSSTDPGSGSPPTGQPPSRPGPESSAADAIISSFGSTMEGLAPVTKAAAIDPAMPPVMIPPVAPRPSTKSLPEPPVIKEPKVAAPPDAMPSESAPQTKIVPEAVSPSMDVISTPTKASFRVPDLSPGILLGSHEITPQFGILGRHSDSSVAIDLTGCNTVSLFGVQGFRKIIYARSHR